MYEAYIEKLKRRVTEVSGEISLIETSLSKANVRLKEFEKELRKIEREKEAQEKIATLELPHRVHAIAKLVYERVDSTRSLIKNRADRAHFYGLSLFVKSGKLPSYMKNYSPVEKAHWIMYRAMNLMLSDETQKGANLVSTVTGRFREVRDEWIKESNA